jgi:sugar phosphate isomerase/epimerase
MGLESTIKDRVFAIHLHDNFKKKDDHNLPFDGTVNFEDAIKKIKDMNYNGYVIIESGYSNYYNNLSIEDYYKLAYERGLKVNEMFSKEVNK